MILNDLNKLQELDDLTLTLLSQTGFFIIFYKIKKKFCSNKECYYYLEDIYFRIFKQYKFSDYQSFKTSKHKFDLSQKH